MTEMTMARLYEFMVILYAVGIVFYFIDYLYKYVKARRVAFWFVCIAWLMQTMFFVLFIIETQRFPVLTLFEGIYFYAWLLTTLSIGLHCIARVDMPVFFVNMLSFVFVTIHLFAPTEKVQPMVDALVSEMMVIHVSFAIMSYAAFSLGFVFSILYLILYRILKQKKVSPMWSRLPSLQQTSSWMRNSTMVGVPLLFISLILGLEWALMTLDRLSVFDIKIVGSFIITVVYFIILLLHRSGKLTGTSYAWVQIYAYLLTIVNLFLGNKLSNFHLWY